MSELENKKIDEEVKEEELTEEKKRLFFFQFKSSFFSEETTNVITTLAKDNGDNENDYLIFYLKLVCMSLEAGGYFLNENYEPFTPKSLRLKLAFSSSGTKKDYELVERIIMSFEEAGIIEFTSGREIYIPSVKYMAMSKKEDSERIANMRRKTKMYEEERRFGKIKYKNEDFEILFQRCFGLLLLMHYAKQEEIDKFRPIFRSLAKDVPERDILDATSMFSAKIVDMNKIGEKFNYLHNTLISIIEKDLKLARANSLRMKANKEALEIASYNWVNNE